MPSAFTGAVATFVQVLPLAVLAGVFQWMWLARHPVAAETNVPASHN